MIYYSIPWDDNKNIGQSYNRFMELLPNDDDYACFIDADACFTTYFYGKQLNDIVKKYPNTGVFTCLTNRIGAKCQRLTGINNNSNDIRYHRRIGSQLFESSYDIVKDITDKCKMSGVLMLIKKETWKKVDGFNPKGILGVDNDFHVAIRKHKEKVYLMTGVYVYHWYRNGTGDKSHLK